MRELFFVGKRVLVLGMGISGRSAVEFLLAHGASVHGVDRDAHLLASHPEIQKLKQAGLTVCFEKDFQSLTQFDLLILSPRCAFEPFFGLCCPASESDCNGRD